MSKQHAKPKPDPREERERHLHRIELYERRQREAAAAGQPVGVAGRARAAVVAMAARVAKLFRREQPVARATAAPKAGSLKEMKFAPRNSTTFPGAARCASMGSGAGGVKR